MLNEDLIDNIEVIKLKQTINAFKKYDDERKKYISKLEIEIGELKSYIEEIESDLGIEKLRTKVKNQAKQLHELNQMIHLSRMTKGRVKELEYVTKDQLYSEIKKLKGDLLRERNSNEQLWSIIAKYRNKFGEI